MGMIIYFRCTFPQGTHPIFPMNRMPRLPRLIFPDLRAFEPLRLWQRCPGGAHGEGNVSVSGWGWNNKCEVMLEKVGDKVEEPGVAWRLCHNNIQHFLMGSKPSLRQLEGQSARHCRCGGCFDDSEWVSVMFFFFVFLTFLLLFFHLVWGFLGVQQPADFCKSL